MAMLITPNVAMMLKLQQLLNNAERDVDYIKFANSGQTYIIKASDATGLIQTVKVCCASGELIGICDVDGNIIDRPHKSGNANLAFLNIIA